MDTKNTHTTSLGQSNLYQCGLRIIRSSGSGQSDRAQGRVPLGREGVRLGSESLPARPRWWHRVQRAQGTPDRRLGEHGRAFHETRAQGAPEAVQVEALQADERYGYTGDKGQPAWEAELRDPVSKFVIAHVQSGRNEPLIRTLLADGVRRLVNPQDWVLYTDGEPSYATLFPELFGQPYRPRRRGHHGRGNPLGAKMRFQIPRTPALFAPGFSPFAAFRLALFIRPAIEVSRAE